MTLGELIFSITRQTAMDDTVPDDRTNLVAWANAGVVDLLLETRCTVDPGEMTLTIGQPAYRLDSNMLAILTDTVRSQNQLYDLEVVPLEELRHRQRVSSSSPTQLLAIEGDLAVVYPTPTQADVISFDYVPRPTPLTIDSHDPSSVGFGRIPKEYHTAIEAYMLWRAARFDDKKVAESPQDLFKMYQFEVARVRRFKRNKRGRQPLRARIGYPGRVSSAGRNDQDVVH